MAMLEVKDLEVYYGMIQAIKGISFEVNKGEVIALIGANGAGKTTTLHTITGLLSPKKGSVIFEGKDITKIPAHKIVSMGMAHVPEGRRVFADLSVYENLKLGAYTRKDKENLNKDLENIYKRFPRLAERKNQSAGTLSSRCSQWDVHLCQNHLLSLWMSHQWDFHLSLSMRYLILSNLSANRALLFFL